MYGETLKNIYLYKKNELTQKQIAEQLSISVGYVNQIICSEKYKEYCNLVEEDLEIRRESSPAERTRRLVDEMLIAVESQMDDATSPSDKLRLMDNVKRLVDIVGIEADDSQGLNVVEVPSMMDKDEFNRAGAKRKGQGSTLGTKQEQLPLPELETVSVDVNSKVCTGVQLGIGPNTQNPMSPSVEPEGYETPTPTHISQNSEPGVKPANPWDDIRVEGID